jgi:hypothetical protein
MEHHCSQFHSYMVQQGHHSHMLSRARCYNGVTVELLWCNIGFTVVLLKRYSGVTVVFITVELPWCYCDVTVLQPFQAVSL